MKKLPTKTKYSILTVPFCSFTFGLCLTTFEILKTSLTQKIGDDKWTILQSIFCWGALIGNLTINLIKISIKKKIILSNLLFLTGTLLLFITNFYTALLARIMIGLGAGIVCCVVPLYLTSLSTLEVRGVVGSFHQLGIVFGVLIGQVMSYYFDKKSPTIPYIMITVFLVLLLFNLLIIQDIETKQVKGKNIVDLVKYRPARKSLLVSLIFHIGQQLSCINGVLLFSNDILKVEGNEKLKTVYVGIVSLISSVLSILVIDKAGRKIMFLSSVFICFISLLVMSFNVYVVFMLFLFMFGFNMGLGPVPWLCVSEIYDDEYRVPGSELAVGANWISNGIVVFLFPVLREMYASKAFLVFAGSLVGVFGLTIWLYKETKGRPAGFL